MNDTKQSSFRCVQVNLLNEFFHSVFSPKTSFSLKDFKVQKPCLTYFDILKNTVRNIIDDIEVTKSRGPNGIPPGLYVKTSQNRCNIMHSVLRNIKGPRKIRDSWQLSAITPIFKKWDRRKVENYRPVSLLNIDSKILEKCIYVALCNHFRKFLTKSQHGFVRGSLQTIMLLFLKRRYEALNHDSHSEIIAFYTDFSRAFWQSTTLWINSEVDWHWSWWMFAWNTNRLLERSTTVCACGQHKFEDTRNNRRFTTGVTPRPITVLYIY